jgi:membrane peptidoglycan carboxypeptidase
MRSIPVPGQSTWPHNYDNTYHGAVNMRQALANSYNVPAVKVLAAGGRDGRTAQLFEPLRLCQLGDRPQFVWGFAHAGGGEITLLELTSGYSVFANHGARVQPTAILCVVKSDGTLLYQYETTCPQGDVSPQTVARNGLGVQVLDPRIAFLIGDILGITTPAPLPWGAIAPCAPTASTARSRPAPPIT